MKTWLKGFFYSFPIQLVFLHFRKYQVLLVVLVRSVQLSINGTFMKTFGADSLFLAPEYLGNVNSFSSAIVGASIGMFIMSWNIATFILFSRHFRFLAATTNPFLKYCINNSIIPGPVPVILFFKAYQFEHYKELIPYYGNSFPVRWFSCGIDFYTGRLFHLFFPGRPFYSSPDDAGDQRPEFLYHPSWPCKRNLSRSPADESEMVF